MKKIIMTVITLCAAFCGSAEQLDHWVYDSSAATISDGTWTFNVTLSGSNITVKEITG